VYRLTPSRYDVMRKFVGRFLLLSQIFFQFQIDVGAQVVEEPPADPAPEVVEEPILEQLIINEILRGSEVNPDADHFIEIYNPNTEPVLLEGWQINGVTSGGRFINLTSDPLMEIGPEGYFLLSRYTNSSSSVLSVKPQVTKSSISIPEGDILIQLRNPAQEVVDEVLIQMADFPVSETIEYRSFERLRGAGDGSLPGSWMRATEKVGLKADALITYATPSSVNSLYLPVGEVSQFSAQASEILDEETGLTVNQLELSWQNPVHERLTGLRLYRLDPVTESWVLLDYLQPVAADPEAGIEAMPLSESYFLSDYFPLEKEAYKLTTLDVYGQESPGQELWLTPKYPIVINELLPNPIGTDAEGEFIELKNVGGVSVDLFGWTLDNGNLDDLKNYTLSDPDASYVMKPGDIKVFPRTETGISLANDGGGVHLFDGANYLVDSFFYDSSREDRSWGREVESHENWTLFRPTPGLDNQAANEAPVPVIDIQGDTAYMHINVTGENSFDPDGDKIASYLWDYGDGTTLEAKNPLSYTYVSIGEKTISLTVTDEFGLSATGQIQFAATEKSAAGGGGEVLEPAITYPTYRLINEVMVNPKGLDSEGEWVELYNNTAQTIDLAGWYLDDAEGKSAAYRIPDGTKMSSGSYLVLRAPEVNLSFKNSEDMVRLLDPNKEEKQRIEYFSIVDEWSYAKTETGSFEWTPLFTPGNQNDFPAPPKAYSPGDLVFEAVLPNPEGTDTGNEAITLKNMTNETIELLGWTIRDLKSALRDLPDTDILPGESMTLGSADFNLTLNNSDETLYLYDPVGNLIDEVSWQSSASGQWLMNPDSLSDGLVAEVVYVVDGDTAVVSVDGKMMKVRLIGVDTPETVHPFKPVEYYGKQASDFLKDLLTGQRITLNFDQTKIDKYGRVLAYVNLGDLFVNAEIIKQGYGYAYTRFPFKYLEEFVAYEEAAKEAGLGIWQNLKVRAILEEEAMLELLEEELPLEELLMLEEILEEVVEEEVTEPEEALELVPEVDCRSEFLKIDSVLPNHEKGVSVEYIRLVNTGSETICLTGWKLDDITDGGSKPFAIKGGSIAAGGVRTFRKQETKIALNNKDDCASLINPDGKVVDQICYGLAHKNETFTHEGGDWVPKKRTSKKKSSAKSARHSFKRSSASYISELANQTYTGLIQNLDFEAQTFLLVLADEEESLLISFENSSVDMAMTELLLDFSELVRVRVYETEEFRNLISISQEKAQAVAQNRSMGGYLLWLLLLLVGLLLYRLRERLPQWKAFS